MTGSLVLHAVLVDSQPGERAPWEILLIATGGVTTIAGFFVIVWKVAKPHIEAYVRAVVAPLQEPTQAVHGQVKPNRGESTLDYARRAYLAATEARAASKDVLRLSRRNLREVERLGDRLARHTDDSVGRPQKARPWLARRIVTLGDRLVSPRPSSLSPGQCPRPDRRRHRHEHHHHG